MHMVDMALHGEYVDPPFGTLLNHQGLEGILHARNLKDFPAVSRAENEMVV